MTCPAYKSFNGVYERKFRIHLELKITFSYYGETASKCRCLAKAIEIAFTLKEQKCTEGILKGFKQYTIVLRVTLAVNKVVHYDN
uniref:60S ribosomal protein L31 n=1 Tax=Heterorhabditis bacteriophora TaxID=37862 RepID=A0A1I7XA93_HETBA